MRYNEKASTFADRFKTARLQANHQDGIEIKKLLQTTGVSHSLLSQLREIRFSGNVYF